MLTTQDLGLNYKFLKLLSMYKLYFTNFNLRTGVVSPETNIWVLGFWKLRRFLLTICLIFKVVRFFQVLANLEETFVIKRFFMQLMNLAVTSLLVSVTYNIYPRRYEMCSLVSMMHADTELKGSGRKVFSWPEFVKSLKAHTIMEQVIMTLPIPISTVAIAPATIMLLDPGAQYLLCSLTPGGLGQPFMFLFLMTIDLWTFVETAILSYLIAYLVLSFPILHLCKEHMSSLLSTAAKYRRDVFKKTRGLLEVRLKVKLFNEVCSFPIYALKLFCLFFVIIALFAAMKLYQKDLIMAVTMFLSAVEAAGLMICFFGFYYRVPELMEDVKQRCEEESDIVNIMSSRDREIVRRQLKSVQAEGIKMGAFYYVDRMSTPEFMEFVVSQLVDLLLTFE